VQQGSACAALFALYTLSLKVCSRLSLERIASSVPAEPILKCLEALQGSAENAVALKATLQAPLLIDPSAQASDWVVAHESARSAAVEVTTMRHPRFATSLELAVRFGKTLVVQDVSSIHPILMPLLRQDLVVQGLGHSVLIGDKHVDYGATFKLILTTRDVNIALLPDVKPYITVTNFTVTAPALEAQLLAEALRHEQPQLEEQRRCAPP
jgi:dynein heavy chain 2, cytosolic